MTIKYLTKLMKAAFLGLFLGCAFAPHLHAGSANLASLSQEKIGELETLHQQATNSVLKNEFSDAIRIYSDILLMEPDDEVAYTNLGQIYMILGQHKKAHEAFKNALDINPHNETAIVGIQKIMDPDGVEGMISKDEIRTEPSIPEEQTVSGVPLEILNPEWIKNFVPGKRVNAQRAKAAAQPLTIAPKQPTITEHRNGAAQAKSPRLSTLMLRPGRLRLQRFQMALKNGGFYNGRVNGLLGITTRKALIRFQKEHKLPPNGKTTSATWAQLAPYLQNV